MRAGNTDGMQEKKKKKKTHALIVRENNKVLKIRGFSRFIDKWKKKQSEATRKIRNKNDERDILMKSGKCMWLWIFILDSDSAMHATSP